MKTDPAPPNPQTISFEAALAPTGNCYAVNAEGEARLTLVISDAAAKPLAEAMAARRLRDRTFVVTLTLP